VVGVLGVFDDVARRTPSGWREDGQAIYLLGTTANELDGSEWANLQGHLGGQPPKADLDRERQLAEILINASRDGMVDAAHDLSEGGLAAALVESSLRFNTGARVALSEVCERDGVDSFTLLFSESQGRAIVAVPRSEEIRFTDMCSARSFPTARIGVVDADSGSLEVQGLFTLPLEEVREVNEEVLPKYFA
jgi:phosphoribosylformylglycinamidine synthase subunit PurL